MAERIARSRFLSRFFDVLIPTTTWLVITLPLWLSPFHPAVVAYFIIAFDLYFFYKATQTVYFASLSYKMILIYQRIPFRKKVTSQSKAKIIQHYIIIPTYQEPLHKLESTINALAQNDYPYDNLHLILAFEDREKEAQKKSKALVAKFKKHFNEVKVTYHKLQEGEAAGKASNQTYAAKIIDSELERKKVSRENILITICDADSHLPKNYFSYLTYQYLKDGGRLYHFYWGPVMLHNNFPQLPFVVRMQATLSSILRLAFLSRKDKLIQISTYSTSLWLLHKIGFWDVDIIPEDWHIYLQAFFKYGDKVRTMPLYTIVNGDAVYSGGLIKTLVNRYEQEKRWAWGVSDIGYALKHSFLTPHIKPWVKLKKIVFLAETHLLWPTSFFVLTVSALIPPLINPVFKRTVLGFLLPQLSSLILTVSTALLLVYTYLDVKLRRRLAQKTRLANLPLLIVQWYLLPVVSFILSSLPALEAHTRIIFGKKIQYKVTEKV
ncbi:glycosyltransferase family 2 protein [Candidatus Roizmanbacteria bacterium]|nr:glycosyltransferase family 2 protein [Candidatus Roizmanbacteria bacterium]